MAQKRLELKTLKLDDVENPLDIFLYGRNHWGENSIDKWIIWGWGAYVKGETVQQQIANVDFYNNLVKSFKPAERIMANSAQYDNSVTGMSEVRIDIEQIGNAGEIKTFLKQYFPAEEKVTKK